jgi:hypothetical protein
MSVPIARQWGELTLRRPQFSMVQYLRRIVARAADFNLSPLG